MGKDSHPSEFLPMRPVDFHVLLALVGRDRHGYGIVKDIESRTEGRIRLVPGNLYPVLRRLVDGGLLTEGGERPSDDPDRKQRRYYGISPLGRRVVAAEALRMKALVQMPEIQDLMDGMAKA